MRDSIDPRISEQVVALDRSLPEQSLAGVIETVPTSRSLLVIFDSILIRKSELKQQIQAMWPLASAGAQEQRLWRGPVAYGGEPGIDLEGVAELHDMPSDKPVECHLIERNCEMIPRTRRTRT